MQFYVIMALSISTAMILPNFIYTVVNWDTMYGDSNGNG